MNRYGKIILLSLLFLFAFTVPAFAREMSIEELGEEATKIYESDQTKGVSYVYVIGQYAFTSQHTLTTQDVMLAARSIKMKEEFNGKNKEAALNEMTIHVIEGLVDSTGKVTDWEGVDNELGTTELGSTVNVRYIDYNLIPEDTEVSVDLEKADQEEYKKVLENGSLNFKGGNSQNSTDLKLEDGKLTGLIKKNTTDVGGFSGDDKTGYYFAFVVEVNGAKEGTTINVKGKKETNATYSNFDKKDGDKGGIVVLMSLDPTSTDKKITVTVDIDGDGNEYLPKVYTIDWSELDFQLDSECTKANIGNGTDVKDKEGYVSESDKNQLKEWGYAFENAGENLQISAVTDNSSLKLNGTVKEQTVNGAGFADADGYYVVIKVYGPSQEQAKSNHYLSQNGNLKKWTVQFKDENGHYKDAVTPTSEEYKNGFITALIKLKDKDDSENQVITYKIDWDGDGDYFLPYEVKIDYSGLTYKTQNKITYIYKDDKGENKEEYDTVYEGDKVVLKDLGIDTNYRKFDGWYKDTESGKTEVGESLTTTADEDLTLTAHWNLDVETFMKDVVKDLNSKDTTYSNDFSGKFDLEQNENDITINVDSVNVPLTELAETSIPGTIAYILEKGEVKNITLNVGSHNVEFNSSYTNNNKNYEGSSDRDNTLLEENGIALKKEIIKGAKEAFDNELSDNEETTTLDELEYEDKSFSIDIGKADETVTLVDSKGNDLSKEANSAKKKYTFTFDSDFVVVDEDSELGAKKIEDALSSDKNYSTIYIDGDITTNNTITVNESVDIKPVGDAEAISLADADNTTVSVTSGENVFDITSGTVNISNLELKGGAKSELKVEGTAKVTANNLILTKGEKELEEGILVTAGTLNASNITFDEETHEIPTVKVPEDKKSAVRVTLSNSTKVEGNVVDIVIHDGKWEIKDSDPKSYSYSDEYKWNKDAYYYTKKENVKDYVIVGFMDNYNLKYGMHKVCENNGSVKPTKYEESEIVCNAKDGKTLYFVGWGRMNTSPQSMKYSEIITDWSTEKASKDRWYFAYYVERDENNKVTVENSDIDGANGTYYTYKFADKTEGMTIGELKKIDSKFAETYKKLEEKAQSSGQSVVYTNGDSSGNSKADDNTKITGDIKLKVGNSN